MALEDFLKLTRGCPALFPVTVSCAPSLPGRKHWTFGPDPALLLQSEEEHWLALRSRVTKRGEPRLTVGIVMDDTVICRGLKSYLEGGPAWRVRALKPAALLPRQLPFAPASSDPTLIVIFHLSGDGLPAPWISPESLARLARANNRPLSPRETAVLKLIATGRSTKEIASELKISQRTAEWHRLHLEHKLGVRSVAGLVHAALRRGLCRPE
jgi:DNA-binding CsgD family transcriptional regulator